MQLPLKIIFLILNFSLLAGGTPLEVEISFGGGYDNNAMRFSDNEISDSEIISTGIPYTAVPIVMYIHSYPTVFFVRVLPVPQYQKFAYCTARARVHDDRIRRFPVLRPDA